MATEKVSVEFEVKELLKHLEILDRVTDEGPLGEGWQSDELEAFILKLEEALARR